MEPVIKLLEEKLLIGKHLTMSLAQNRTPELWRAFMPLKKQIQNTLSADLYSLQLFPPGLDFALFNPDIVFEKWAAVEVAAATEMPGGLEVFILPAGLYAVFTHHGPASEGERTFRYIFNEWIPNSPYTIDDRPHFEVLGAKYKNDSPDSEEEVWIPVRKW